MAASFGDLATMNRHRGRCNTQSIRIIKAYFSFVCKPFLKHVDFFSPFFFTFIFFLQHGVYCNPVEQQVVSGVALSSGGGEWQEP